MISRLFHNLTFWYLLGLANIVLWWLTLGIGGPYWFAESLLYLIFFLGLWLDSRYHFREKLTLSREKAVFLYFVIFLAASMVYERRYHYTFKELYFSAGAASLTEGIVFNGVLIAVLLSPTFFLAPLTFAYYMLVYGVIFCMPFVFMREELLWSSVGTTISFRQKMLYAFIATFFAYLTWVGWAKMADILTNGFEKF
ncbi:MAG: hypothetical protein UW97_C0033G0011 [Parcubacteria group bacterium GW2011_GWA2_45_15]|nr:MAG: hypothetical protein UW97_C0033G0011 [Parcubacteria group bacterium GW2011_GWA2_45_15]